MGLRDLRNHGGDVLARVQAGEHLIVTRSGRPVAELRPLGQNALAREVLVGRWKQLPRVDYAEFRRDVSAGLDDAV